MLNACVCAYPGKTVIVLIFVDECQRHPQPCFDASCPHSLGSNIVPPKRNRSERLRAWAGHPIPEVCHHRRRLKERFH